MAMRIYMTIRECNEISDYWDTSKVAPSHPIAKYVARDQFQEPHMRFRIRLDYSNIYIRVLDSPTNRKYKLADGSIA
jgi:hypothetical protein